MSGDGETKVLHLKDKAVIAFLASLAQTVREIDSLQRTVANSEEDLETVLVARLKEFVIEGLHKDLHDRDCEAVRNMFLAFDTLRTQDKPILIPISPTAH